MKRLMCGLIIASAIACLISPSVGAATQVSEPPSEPPTSPLKVSAYYFSLEKIDVAHYVEIPRYVELYNSSSTPVNPTEYILQITTPGVETLYQTGLYVKDKIGYIQPDGFLLIDLDQAVTGEGLDGVFQAAPKTYEQKPGLTRTIQLLQNTADGPRGVYEKSLTLKNPDTTTQQPVRLVFRTVTSEEQAAEMTAVYDTPLYTPAASFPLAPTEILANPKTCAPNATANDCFEYIKFYNPSDGKTIDFAGTRLRVGALGQTSSASNTTILTGTLEPGKYAIFKLPITNSGGYVWLEDLYGALPPFSNTVVAYPDASSSSHKGESWADFGNSTWDWATPNPGGPNMALPPEDVVGGKGGGSELVPCRADQYRNPLTNRCNLIRSTASSLTACAANQYRNPETNRCKSLASTASSLKPCAKNQERNPATNRCRNVASSIMPSADFAVTKTSGETNSGLGWWAFAGVGALALGYAGWEWRFEIARGFRKLVGLVAKT